MEGVKSEHFSMEPLIQPQDAVKKLCKFVSHQAVLESFLGLGSKAKDQPHGLHLDFVGEGILQ